MRFSMNSYLLGVGTVVGALAFGFGGGILLTKTAIKDTPAGPSRMERVARPEPAAPQLQVTEAKAVPVPRADPLPAVQPASEPAPPVQAAAETVKPVMEAPKVAEPVRQIDTSKQVEQPAQQADAPKQMEQPIRQSDARQIEQKEFEPRAEREQRRAERRRIERERKARTMIVVGRERPIEAQDQPARPELAFEREEPRPNLFEGLFGRPTGDSRE
jgi:hypothetical protein